MSPRSGAAVLGDPVAQNYDLTALRGLDRFSSPRSSDPWVCRGELGEAVGRVPSELYSERGHREGASD